MNASPAEQMRLLDLQALDAQLDRLAHRRATLPEIAELQRIGGEQAATRDDVVVAETEAGDIRREQDKFEGDIAQVRQRIVRDQQRMDAGAVSSAKELESLQHEIDSLHRRQTALEDSEIEVMERLEVVENRLASLVARSEQLAAASKETEERRDAALAEIDVEVRAVQADREGLAPTLPADLLALYDKLRAQFGGVGAAALRQKRCDGCRLELNATDIGRVRAAEEDEVLRCEECRRILVRTPEAGI
ncbi:MAG: C4-type zinc ribbon domain-containing protein [Actinomycetota bacterium]|nr:C4-type zinc ribbon domain-containing protein [Actinomycetota bacterium]